MSILDKNKFYSLITNKYFKRKILFKNKIIKKLIKAFIKNILLNRKIM